MKSIQIVMDEGLWAQVRQRALQEKRSAAACAAEALREWLGREVVAGGSVAGPSSEPMVCVGAMKAGVYRAGESLPITHVREVPLSTLSEGMQRTLTRGADPSLSGIPEAVGTSEGFPVTSRSEYCGVARDQDPLSSTCGRCGHTRRLHLAGRCGYGPGCPCHRFVEPGEARV